MNTFIIVLIIAIAFVISPMLKILPTPREKEQMKLRNKARELGMQVQLARIPTAAKTKEQSVLPNGAAYRLPREREQKKLLKTHTTYLLERDSTAQHNWQWFNPKLQAQNEQSTLYDILNSLNDDIQVFESTPNDTSVYWREKGSVEDVEFIASQLRAIQQTEAKGS